MKNTTMGVEEIMKRKWMTAFLIAIMICLSYQVVYAEKMQLIYDGETHLYELVPISLYINGELTITTVMPPIQIEGNTLVPAREVFAKMGAEVLWKSAEKSVYITKGEQLIVLTIDSTEVWVDGEIKVANMPAKLINDKVMIPLRFISEALGFKVQWIDATKTIMIEEPIVVAPPVVVPPEESEMPEEGTSEELPEETPEPNLSFKNMTYDSSLNALILEKAPGLTVESITVQDNYIQRQIKITLPTAYIDFYEAGIWEDTNSAVKKIEVKQSSSTEITLTTATIKALNVYEYDNKIYLQCVKQKEKYGKIVVVDAGHGKDDPGTTYGSLQEKDITLRLALQLQKEIANDSSIKVYMIREGDTFLTPMERAVVANEIEPDLFISIHVNSVNNNASASGTETYYTAKADTRNKIFAEMVQKALINTFGTRNRGVKDNTFVVTRYTNYPAILIEIGFLTNESDRQMMLSAGFEQKYATAVYNCIQNYYAQGLNETY